MVLSLIGIVLYSQNGIVDKYLDFDDTGFLFIGASTDVITTTDTTWMYTIHKKMRSEIKCVVELLIDSTGGTANNVVIVLQNKHFPVSTYATVSTTTWDGANDDSNGKRISFKPSSQSFTFTAAGVDSISGVIALDTLTLLSLTDTTGLSGYPADSIVTGVPPQAGTFTATIKPTTFTLSVTESDQYYMGEYWRVLLTGADNTLLASIRWLNFKFIE